MSIQSKRCWSHFDFIHLIEKNLSTKEYVFPPFAENAVRSKETICGFEVRMTSRVPLGCVDESELIVEDKVAASLGQKLENLDEAFRRIIIGLREWSVTESLFV